MLEDFPVRWTSPVVRQTLQILQTVYRQSDIERIVEDAGIPPHELIWGPRPADTWRSVLEVSAGRARVGELLDAVSSQVPALSIRLAELRAAQATMMPDEPSMAGADLAQADSPGWKNFSQDGRAEAIIVAGQPTFVDIAFLAVGLLRARGVCRLRTHFPGEGSGTAFRVGPTQLLTNYHVLFNREDADRKVTAVQAWFNYESDELGALRQVHEVRCRPDTIVGEKADDWALIETEEAIPDTFPALSIVGGRTPMVDDRVYIIQHPHGQPKKVAFQHNLVRAVEPDRIQYWTDTDLGSSGSPVFDQDWDVVALHHFSVPAPQGDRITVRNQGRRIDRVVERMRLMGVYPGGGQ